MERKEDKLEMYEDTRRSPGRVVVLPGAIGIMVGVGRVEGESKFAHANSVEGRRPGGEKLKCPIQSVASFEVTMSVLLERVGEGVSRSGWNGEGSVICVD